MDGTSLKLAVFLLIALCCLPWRRGKKRGGGGERVKVQSPSVVKVICHTINTSITGRKCSQLTGNGVVSLGDISHWVFWIIVRYNGAERTRYNHQTRYNHVFDLLFIRVSSQLIKHALSDSSAASSFDILQLTSSEKACQAGELSQILSILSVIRTVFQLCFRSNARARLRRLGS